MEKRLLTVKETAKMLNVSTHTIYYWTYTRKIPYVKASRLIRFDVKDIDKWIERNKIKEKNY